MIGFMHPLMLIGMVAVGLPVAIHFLTRARPRLIRFPTFHLLVESGSGRQAMHRLRTWLVLLLRTLAVAAVVLVFAQPVVRERPPEGEEHGDESGRRVVLLVDASASMRAVSAGVPVFTQAVAQAADLLRRLEDGSEAAVVFIGAEPRTILPALSRNLAALHEGLSAAKPTHEAADPAAALALAGRLLKGAGEVFIFSDFQRTNWDDALNALPGVSLVLRPVMEQGVDNAGIIAVAQSPAEPIAGEPVDLIATVFNATPHEREQMVRLELQGVSQQAKVRLQPFSSAPATFSFSLPISGTLAGQVALQADALAADDTRYFRLKVREELRVLLISDADPADPRSGGFFVQAALSPSPQATPGVQVIRRISQDADRGSLETADVFCLVSPVRPSGEAVEIIARRVAEGAQLICMLDGSTAADLVSALAGASQGLVTPPYQILAPVSASGGGETFSRVMTREGPLRAFHTPEQGDLKQLRFARHLVTRNDFGRMDEVLASFADGSAALTLSPAGAGSVVFVNFPIAPEHANIAGSPLFAPMLHELLRALRRSGPIEDPEPGRRWQVDVDSAESAQDAAVAVTGPKDQPLEATVLSRGRTTRLALAPAQEPGIYRVRLGDRPAAPAVVNLSVTETDTRQLNLTEAAQSLGNVAAMRIIDAGGEIAAVGQPQELWPSLAALAALCFAAEMALLALWQGGSKRSFRGRDPAATRTAPAGGEVPA